MDKNLLLAVSLSILVYAAWFGFVEKRIAPPPAPQPALTATEAGKPNPTIENKVVAPAPAPAPAQPAVKPGEPDKIEDAVVDGAQVKIRSRGAALSSWQFKGPRGLVELVAKPEPGLLSTFPDVAFRRVETPGRLVYAGARGPLKITKEFVAGGENVLPRLKITLENTGGQAVESGPWTISAGPGLGTIPTELEENESVTRVLGLTKAEGGLQGKIETIESERPADFRWVGVDNRYFLVALLPQPGEFEKAKAQPGHQLLLTAKSKTVPPRGSVSWEVPYYVGAKGHTWLSRYKAGLERAIDFGFFAQLGRFVLKALDRIHDVVGNWGWAIIILTVILQIVLFPLTYKSLKATAAMKRLQPEIARLQQRYAKEPQKLNMEMMELYKKHGANPLGGCLPMLLQMPVFIALYNALRNAWELHGAGWVLWINDLSAKDPYYVLPVVMGALMYFQNKLNPMAGVDPTQQKMMAFMPVIFTVMFINFPSGLVLYWLTNSLVSTLQQLALKSHFEAAA